ncbi:MAG: hypothetical protein CL610_21090 [Anaerolineaceae bacterium]|nr:hypothetical protein [Anaerolineaceae bacterium]
MQLLIEGELRQFVPIKNFRQQFDLPDAFGISMFEPKDYTGLGQIDSAGPELNVVRRAVLDAIPTEMPLQEWLAYLPHLTRLFESKLHEVNPEIGLKQVEVEFAVSGFQNICQGLIYAMIQARAAGEPMPEFQRVYADWLNSTVRISSTVHSYVHKGETWAVQIVNTAYGRNGLIVWTEAQTHYLHDSSLACPAEGFMQTLLNEVATRILLATDAAPPETANG